MRLAELTNKVNNIKKGTFVRVGYVTDLKSSVNASSKKQGIKVEKKVEKTVRLGCDYHNMKATIQAKADGRGTREMYEEAVIEDVLYENKKNGTLYLRVGTVKNSNNNTVWLVNGVETELEEVKKYLVPSYFKSNGYAPEVQNIKLENVYMLG